MSVPIQGHRWTRFYGPMLPRVVQSLYKYNGMASLLIVTATTTTDTEAVVG